MDIAQTRLIAAIILLSIAPVTATFSMSVIGRKFLESLARQPEMSSMLQGKFLMLAAFVEATPMMAAAAGLYLIFTN